MPHHSRLSGLVIDCDTDGLDGLDGAAAFRGAALGDARGRKPQAGTWASTRATPS